MPDSLEVATVSPDETQRLAKKIGQILNEGDIILLSGELGAGKTTFTIGLARGLGVRSPATSPTYTIINEYDGRIPVYHLDLYRLESLEEMEVIGYEEYYFGKGVTVVEWGDKIESSMPEDYLGIDLKRLAGDDNSRSFVFKGSSAKIDGLVKSISKIAKEIGLSVKEDG